MVAPGYWFLSGDWTGTSALVMTARLTAMITLDLGFHAARMDPRPEDRKEGEIADGAGELGFFSPHSIWPLFLGLTVALAAASVAIGWWLFAIAVPMVGVTVCLFVFEYYRGVHEG